MAFVLLVPVMPVNVVMDIMPIHSVVQARQCQGLVIWELLHPGDVMDPVRRDRSS